MPFELIAILGIIMHTKSIIVASMSIMMQTTGILVAANEHHDADKRHHGGK